MYYWYPFRINQNQWYTLHVGFPDNTAKNKPSQLEQILNNKARVVQEREKQIFL